MELDQTIQGRLSRMEAMQRQAMATAGRRRRRAELERLDSDDVGYCVRCEDSIEPGRLALDPTIVTCRDCAAGVG